MNKPHRTISIIALVIIAVALLLVLNTQDNEAPPLQEEQQIVGVEGVFSVDGLSTDTTQTLIPLDEILGGGPGKDGIPALSGDSITFVKPSKATTVPEDSMGILLEGKKENRFYPYTVLVWHEIVNDTFDGEEVAVTFCPLCGSAIVYSREVDGRVLDFGVSGKLWQSNLLMFDRSTETLWSQIEGRAVVGSYVGTQLELLDSQVMTFAQAQELADESSTSLRVLSDDTGYARSYGFYPYGNYDDTEDLIFPVNNLDTSLPAKTLMQAAVVNDLPVAFAREKVIAQGGATLVTQEGTITAKYDGSRIIISDVSGKEYPSYVTMWFSWANHNDGEVWE